jgi:O-antigen/teichoic acid export membrane protein
MLARSTTFLAITALPLLAIIAAVPGPLLDFVFPAEYAAAAQALILATVAQTALAVIASFTAAITANGRPYLAMSAWLVCIPVQLVAGVALIPRYGMLGTAISGLIAAGVGLLFSGVLAKRFFGRLAEPVPVLKALGAASVVYVLMSIPESYSMVALPFACLGGLGVYLALVMASGAVKRSDIMTLFRREESIDTSLEAPQP